ncbi:MAG: TetR/AcrR family transcriptional regulator [Lachnospiraceae bacterium]|nr:TetR/AcrR family transcriptional regulator [Lachnospiraceae bacterium]
MNKNLDLRVQKTYTCLMNARLDLLKEKASEESTVNELCERALVGRGTFYKHFSDKYEIFSFV